jgi:hypothetical protein
MDNLGVGKYAKYKSWGAFARVELVVHEISNDTPVVSFNCTGVGFTSQGYVEEVPATGYDDWKEGAAAGAMFAFRLSGLPARSVTVTKIEGLTSDTSPASVGAASALAVFSALDMPAPTSFNSLVEEIIFGPQGLRAPFSL